MLVCEHKKSRLLPAFLCCAALPVVAYRSTEGPRIAAVQACRTERVPEVRHVGVVLLASEVANPQRSFPVPIVRTQNCLRIDDTIVGNRIPTLFLALNGLHRRTLIRIDRAVLEPRFVDP